MPRPNFSSPHDIRFLELRPDGSVKAKFEIGHFFLHTEWADLKADLRIPEFHVFLNGSNRPIPVKFTDDDLQDWLPRESGYFVFSKNIEIASAANTNTGIKIIRHNGVSTLRAWRSRWNRYFIYQQDCWLETAGPDPCAFVHNFPKPGDIYDIPF